MLAFILAKIESGKDREALSKIKRLKGTKRAYPTYGPYDMIVEVEFENSRNLDSFVFDKIRKIEGVKETATLICSEMLMWEMGIR